MSNKIILSIISGAKDPNKKSKLFPIDFIACFNYSKDEDKWYDWLLTQKGKYIMLDSIEKEEEAKLKKK